MRHCETKKELPFLECRGSHYEVGFQIGKAFKPMIQDLLSSWKYFQEVLEIGLRSPAGTAITDQCKKLCEFKFPGYMDEIRGMADGAEIPFENLFILNIDSLLCNAAQAEQGNESELEKAGGAGCTTVICNKDEVILGHTEDAMSEIRDHVYIVSAEILGPNGEDDRVLEKFTTLCYAGTLMGYTMGYNGHGMIYSVNTNFPHVCTDGTPRAFIGRAALGARDLPSLVEILKDKGNGVADGFSMNVFFYPKSDPDDGASKVLYNIEVAPAPATALVGSDRESLIDIHEIQPGSVYTHCNKYLRIKTREANPIAVKYSDKRDSTVCRRKEPCCEEDVRLILSDQTDFDYPIYNCDKDKAGEGQYEMSFIKTVAVGIFDISKRTWKVFYGPPECGNPVHIFTLE